MADEVDRATIPARELTILHIDNPQFWRWVGDEVQLLSIQRLNVSGTIDGRILKVGHYEVLYRMTIRNDAYGFGQPVNFEQNLVDASPCEDDKIEFNDPQPQNLFRYPREEPVEIPGGTFTIKEKLTSGTLLFRLYEFGAQWKGGLVINSIVIRPYSP